MNGNFITSSNGSFHLKEKLFRFIGCNMYELANVDSQTTELMMKDAVSEGFKVIRFWAFEPTEKNKLTEICDLARQYDIKIIPVLADTWGYLQNYKIDSGWYKEDYKKSYLGYAKDIAGSFKDRDEILLWELINEPSTDSFADIYNFSKDASEKIKSTDPNHLLSIGTIGGIGDRFGNFFSRFNADNFKVLNSINSLDAVSLHDYSYSSTILERLDILSRTKGKPENADLFNTFDKIFNKVPAAIDNATLNKSGRTFDFPLTIRKIWKTYNLKNIMSAKILNKPVYIGEIGFKKSLNKYRKIVLRKELKKYFNEGISGILLWSFESQGKSLDGHDYGFGIEDGYGDVLKEFYQDAHLMK